MRLFEKLKGVRVETFRTGDEFITTFLEHAEKAKKNHITWGEDVLATSGQELNVYRQYYEKVSKIASKPDVV